MLDSRIKLRSKDLLQNLRLEGVFFQLLFLQVACKNDRVTFIDVTGQVGVIGPRFILNFKKEVIELIHLTYKFSDITLLVSFQGPVIQRVHFSEIRHFSFIPVVDAVEW